jgi:hypothetical protein
VARLLLLGAGFSRNWNGWLADEVRGKLLARLAEDAELHRIVSSSPNFEDAISTVQQDFKRSGSPQDRAKMDRMQAAVMATFRAMNESFAKRPSMEFSNDRHFSIVNFLNRFDAIFTLNQDLLLELHYGNLEVAEPRRWNGHYFPGMNPPTGWLTGHRRSVPKRTRLESIWTPGEPRLETNLQPIYTPGDPRLETNLQPIYKLHGSVNWKEGGTDMLVLGGNKPGTIAGTRLLKWYADEFRRYLEMPDPRLMVIGYGFRDHHIDQMLLEAWKKSGLVLNKHPSATIRVPDPLEEIPIIGESVRPLTTTFNGDDLEHNDLLGFFP